MKDMIVSTLNSYKREVEQEIEDIQSLEEEPLRFFHMIASGRTKTLALIENRDPEYLIEFQSWLYPKVIHSLKTAYRLEDFVVSYYPKDPLSCFTLARHHSVVARIHPYDQGFEYVVPERLLAAYSQREEVLFAIAKAEENLAVKEILESNPILTGKGHPVQTVKALVRQAKIKEELKSEALIELDYLSAQKRQLSDIEALIEQEENRLTIETLDLDRLAKRMKDHLLLTVINPIQEQAEKQHLFLSTTLPKLRQHYREELYKQWHLSLDEAGVAHTI